MKDSGLASGVCQGMRGWVGGAVAVGCLAAVATAGAQQERHGRGYKAPPSTATVVVTVEKAANLKPLANASVIFRAVRNEDVAANLEMKTDPDGHASIDLLEVGSHVTVQVIANGFATYASGFDLTADGKQILVKLQRPRAQVSNYGDGVDRPAETRPGVQEHPRTAAPSTPSPAAPPVPGAPSSPQSPSGGPGMTNAAPSSAAPENTAPASTAPAAPGSPQ